MENQYKKNLSVIIPHYNTPDLLEKLIKSIPNMNDIQIIVIDDNSNLYLEKLSELQDVYCSKVEFYKNNTTKKGAGTCRNIGLKHAEGKWILFADADDFFMDGMYQIVSKYFDSDYDEVFFTPTSIYLDSGLPSNRHYEMAMHINNYIENPTRENLLKLKISLSTPCSKLIRHELIKEHQIWFDEVLYFNDMMFSVKAGHYSQKVIAVRDVIYCITRNKGSLTTHVGWDAYEIRLKEYLKVCNFLLKRYEKKDIKTMHYTSLGMLYRAIQQHYGLIKYIYIINTFCKMKIPLFSCEQLYVKSILQIIKKEKNKRLDNKYYVSGK